MVNEKVLIMGGCNYIKNKCYDDMWEYDFDSSKYTQIYDSSDHRISESRGVYVSD